MSKRHADSTPDEKAPKRRKLSADEVLVEAARNGDTTAVRVGLEKLSTDTDSKKVAFDAVHEACRGNHDECLALLLPYVRTTQMGFGMLLSECVHADHTACTEVLLQHWKSVCSNVAYVPHGQGYREDRPCPAMWEDPAVCQVLIDAGADIETKDICGLSPLHWACRSGVLDVVKVLLKAGAGVCVTDVEGSTCLFYAAQHGHTETVRYLVGLPEVDVNHKGERATAVHVAAIANHADVMEVLIDAGADIETKDVSAYNSPLHVASQRGNLRVVKVLLKAGAGVHVTDNEGDTCLTLAAGFGHTETVRTLLCMPEVDVNQSNDRSYTSLHLAVSRKHYQMFQKHSAVMQVLIDAGADVEAKDDMGCSPLHFACEAGKLEIVQMLVEAGADVCVVDGNGIPGLLIAAAGGHTETVRYLVGLRGVDVNHRDIAGHTALKHARLNGCAGVEKVLLKHGAEQ